MNILLVSDDNEFANKLQEKLVFLRRDDSVLLADYENVFDSLEGVEAVLVHQNESDDAALDLIKNLRFNNELCIIFIANSYDSKIILEAYDLGIDDFVLANADDFEYVIRIVNNIKHNSIKRSATRNFKLLERVKVIDKYSGFYAHEYCSDILSSFKSGTFMALAPCDKIAFSVESFSDVIKSALRNNDIAFLGKGANFYVFLPNSDFNGAVSVFNKINEKVEIRAGISDVSGKEYEKEALNALAEADSGYVFAQTKGNTLDDWLSDAPAGGYKLFRKVFNTKMEKVIAPVFYRLQKSYEEKLFETEIEQYTNSEQCVFSLKNDNGESSLRIVYPGFAKIMIYINHEGLDSPENREIALSLDKITQKELIRITEDFIEEFKETKCYR